MTSEPKWIVWTQSPKANTAIGTAAGIVGLLGATAVASTAPVAGAVLSVLGAGISAGALYRKVTEAAAENRPPHP
jgi:hypothetical protein